MRSLQKLVGSYVQIHCVDSEDPTIEWWEWGSVDYVASEYLVMKDDDGDYILIMVRDIKEVFAIEGRKRVYEAGKRSRKKK